MFISSGDGSVHDITFNKVVFRNIFFLLDYKTIKTNQEIILISLNALNFTKRKETF